MHRSGMINALRLGTVFEMDFSDELLLMDESLTLTDKA